MTSSTLIAYCLDKSGSMNCIRNDVIGSTNSFVQSQNPAQNPEIEQTPTYIGVCTFSAHDAISWTNNFITIGDYVPLDDKTYRPLGPTALYDGITTTIEGCDKYISDHPDQSVKVIVVIQTDGEENASRYATNDTVKKLISAKTEMGWTFTFLGANQDACLTAQHLGIHGDSALNYSAASGGSQQAGQALSSAVSRMRSCNQVSRTDSVQYSQEERDDQQQAHPRQSRGSITRQMGTSHLD